MPELLAFKWRRPKKPFRIEGPEDDLRLVPDEEWDDGVLYKPLEIDPPIWQQLHNIDDTPAAIKGFADKYGPLTVYSDDNSIKAWRRHIGAVRDFIGLWMHSVPKGAKATHGLTHWFNESATSYQTRLEIRWYYGKPSLHLVPLTLIAAIWLQIGMAITSGTGLRACKWCRQPFMFGSGTSRRKSGHFCSDKCRKASWKAVQEGSKS